MQQYYRIYEHREKKNNLAIASLVLSIISINFLISIVPLFFVGGLLVSMAGQHPSTSLVDIDDPQALAEYYEGSRLLGTTGMALVVSPSIISGITGIFGLVFGIFGARIPRRRGLAIAGIVISSIPFLVGAIVILIAFPL